MPETLTKIEISGLGWGGGKEGREGLKEEFPHPMLEELCAYDSPFLYFLFPSLKIFLLSVSGNLHMTRHGCKYQMKSFLFSV